MKSVLATIWAFSLALLMAAASATAADKSIIVLDASGSMWGQIGGTAKISIARETLAGVLGATSPDLELGLVVYGHREKSSCGDIELVVPPAAGSGNAIAAAVNRIQPKGRTPLSDAVRQSAGMLNFTESKATVILITDGIETCDADPCAVGAALEAAGVDLTVHVVGFGLSADEGRQVACLAENTGGRYFTAEDAAGLGAALTESVAEVVAPSPPPPPPPPQPEPEEAKVLKNLRVVARPAVDADPFPASDGVRFDIYPAETGIGGPALVTAYGEPEFELAPGAYVVSARKDLASGETMVDVAADRQSVAEVDLNAAYLHVVAMATETVPAGNAVRLDVAASTGDAATTYGPTWTVLVPAGAGSATGSLGSASASVPIEIVAGEDGEVVLVLQSGRLALRGKRAAEAADYDNGIRWDVTGGDGRTETTYGGEVFLDVAAGDYSIVASLGEARAEATLSVAAGETAEAMIVVDTGRLVAHALFAEGGPVVTAGPRFDVLEAELGMDGSRKVIATTYNDGATFDLAPGRYILRATSDEASAEAGFVIVAGPPVEVSVVLDAGLLAISAPGASRLDLLSAKKDIYGKQAILTTTYGTEWSLTVPAGDYQVLATTADGAETRLPAMVTAGERTEVSFD